MRRYFRHARHVNRLASIMLDEVVPARSSIYQQFQSWRSRLSNRDFSVVNGRVYLQQPSSIANQDVFLRVFEFVAQHGFKLAGSTEQRLEQALAVGFRPAIVGRRTMAGVARGFDSPACRPGPALHAGTWRARSAGSRIQRARFAGRARLLPSLYGRRAYLPCH